MGVGGDDGCELGEREGAEGGEGGVGRGEVGGVVERGLGGEGERRVVGRGEHRGGVGLDEEAIEGDLLVERAEAGVAGGEVGGVEGKIGAEGDEGRDHFGGAAVGVEEEAAGREAARGVEGLERFEEKSEGVDAVDSDGAVESDGEGELGFEDSELFVERGAAEAGEAGVVGPGAVEYPAVEADFTDGGVRIGGEVGAERVEPSGSAVADIPGVEAVGGEEAEGGRRAESRRRKRNRSGRSREW